MHQPEKEFSFKQFFIPFTTLKAIHFLILIGFLVFFNGLFNNFVGDDNSQIVQNPAIQSVTNIPKFFWENRLTIAEKQALGGYYYKPLLDTSFASVYSLFGPNVFAYHFFQILLHSVNACLIFIFFKSFFRKFLAFGLAVIFLIHPINSEAALYISAIQEVLFFFFGMTALLLLKNSISQKTIIAAACILLLSLFSKETGIVFFLITLIYLFFYKTKKISFPFIVFGAVLSGYFFLRMSAVGIFPYKLINAPIQNASLADRLTNIPEVFLYYIKTFLFPLHLSSSYQWLYTTRDFQHFFLPLFLDGIFLVFICAFARFLYKKHQKYFNTFVFFALWFFIGIGLHLQIFPLDQTVAERWFYFPVVGLLGMMGVAIESVKRDLAKKWFIALVVVIFLLLSIRTIARTFDMSDDFTLASHDLSVSPEAYNLEYIVSHIYYERGNLSAALTHAKKSVTLFPYITNYTNLGAIYSRMGDYKNAKEAYTKALRYGEDSLPYENLSSLALVYGDRKENIQFIKNTAIKKYSTDGQLWFNLAVLDYMEGNTDDAKTELAQAKRYFQTGNMDFIEYVFANNKELHIKVTGGNVSFYTY